MVIVILLGWLLAALPTALLIGGGIHLADQRDEARMGAEPSGSGAPSAA